MVIFSSFFFKVVCFCIYYKLYIVSVLLYIWGMTEMFLRLYKLCWAIIVQEVHVFLSQAWNGQNWFTYGTLCIVNKMKWTFSAWFLRRARVTDVYDLIAVVVLSVLIYTCNASNISLFNSKLLPSLAYYSVCFGHLGHFWNYKLACFVLWFTFLFRYFLNNEFFLYFWGLHYL